VELHCTFSASYQLTTAGNAWLASVVLFATLQCAVMWPPCYDSLD